MDDLALSNLKRDIICDNQNENFALFGCHCEGAKRLRQSAFNCEHPAQIGFGKQIDTSCQHPSKVVTLPSGCTCSSERIEESRDSAEMES